MVSILCSDASLVENYEFSVFTEMSFTYCFFSGTVVDAVMGLLSSQKAQKNPPSFP